MRLEAEVGGRSVVPTDPALAMVDSLLEDFADEWLTKAMYHYRWAYEADIDKAGRLLPLSSNLQLDSDARGAELPVHHAAPDRSPGARRFDRLECTADRSVVPPGARGDADQVRDRRLHAR